MQQPKSMMEEMVRKRMPVAKPLAVDYVSLTPEERTREKTLIRIELERIGEHIRDIEEHLSHLREHQSDLFFRKDKLERLMVPALVIKLEKKPKPTSIKTQILSKHSIDEIETILAKARNEGRI